MVEFPERAALFYREIRLLESMPIKPAGETAFIDFEEPLPVGTLLELRPRLGENLAVKVVAVRERPRKPTEAEQAIRPGMQIKPV